MGIHAHMICHTHWDREWYFTREQFRTKLIRLIDGLLELTENSPEYVSFLLDGQTIVIEDYLEVKPYNKKRLFSALKTGRIICGPWYILPDELLISGESHIRNYIMGTKVLENIENKMKIAYLPDSFGHPSQMPQIAEGLGMNAMVFWRGVSNEVKNTEFYWQSPYSGSKILCVHLPHGYGNCGNLSENPNETIPRVKELFESLGAKATTDVVLLMNGSDHITAQKNIVDIVKMLNNAFHEYKITLSTLEAFIAELTRKLPELKTFSGEFRSGERSMLLGGTISTRMELKQNNDYVETFMERYLEPIFVGERLLGGNSDVKGYSNYIWKKILENQPHDSICGCSIDKVHSEMLARYESLRTLQETLLKDTVKRITDVAQSDINTDKTQFFLFEPNNDNLSSYIEADIDMDRVLVQEVNFIKSTIENYEPEIIHPEIPRQIKITDEKGRIIPNVILSAQKGYDTLYQDSTLPEIYKTNHFRVGMLLPGFSYGFHMLTVEKSQTPCGSVKNCSEAFIENEYYKIFSNNGSLTVEDKKTGKIHSDVHRLIDKGDAGDEYTYSWLKQDAEYTLLEENVTVKKIIRENIGECLVITGNLKLPESLTEDRLNRSTAIVNSPVTTEVSLFKGIDRIDFCTKLYNNSKDHRLQVQFPSSVKTSISESYDIFNITKRDVEVVVPEKWVEYPQSTHPTHGFINLEDESCGFSVMTKGLPEFEAVQTVEGTKINLTLLRSVGWLSRTDLITREGNGGWTIETKNAQCLKEYTFEYSISYHKGSYRSGNSFGLMEKAKLPSVILPVQSSFESSFEMNPLEFLSELPKEIRISAVKISEDYEGIIVRLFSIGNKNQNFELELPHGLKRAELTNLAEEKIQEIEILNNRISLEISPSQIITMKFLN